MHQSSLDIVQAYEGLQTAKQLKEQYLFLPAKVPPKGMAPCHRAFRPSSSALGCISQ